MKLTTFDFDSTLLHIPFRDLFDTEREEFPVGVPFQQVIDLMKQRKEDGHTVAILTTRMDEHMEEVHKFVEHFDLPVSFVWNTNFEWKAKFMLDLLDDGLSIFEHFDDNPEEFFHVQNEERLNHVKFTLFDGIDLNGFGIEFMDCRAEENRDKMRVLIREVSKPIPSTWGW